MERRKQFQNEKQDQDLYQYEMGIELGADVEAEKQMCIRDRFNIGAEGQLMVGACASIATAVLFPQIPVVHMLVSVLAGILAGAAWGFLPGILKSKFNLHEVVICIMMNYIGMYLACLLYTSVIRQVRVFIR